VTPSHSRSAALLGILTALAGALDFGAAFASFYYLKDCRSTT
jgi:hypothetical protein